jgi:hypothetical protein
MPTGLETKTSSSGAPKPVSTIPSPTRQARRGHARRNVAELIDVAITGVYPSPTEARQARRWFLIRSMP